MHANAASALEEYARPGAKVLDVGCGSGYLTAVILPALPRSTKIWIGLIRGIGIRKDG